MLTQEQTEIVKRQLIQHIEKNLPENRKTFAVQQIMDMNSEELEDFLRKNKLMSSKDPSKPGGCIFCSIVKGEINSYRIGENPEAIAVLEINPLSKGHIMIIPNKHLSSAEEIPASIFSFAKKISKKIKTKLGSKEAEISSSNVLGHEVINIIPLYGEKKPEKRQQAKPEDLLELKELLSENKQIVSKSPRKTSIKAEEKIWLPKRIP